jgi:hypothetical protein
MALETVGGALTATRLSRRSVAGIIYGLTCQGLPATFNLGLWTGVKCLKDRWC